MNIFVLNFFSFFVKTSFVKLFANYIYIVVMFFSISQKYGCDYCSTSIHRSFWYANVLCEHDDKGTYGQLCLYDWMMCHVTMIEHVQCLLHLYPFFISYVSLFENYVFRTMMLYFLTYVLCVQRIVVVVSKWDGLFWFCMKHFNRTLLIFAMFGFLTHIMLNNCKYSRFVVWCMEMDIKWCCIIFQDGTNLMWQGLHKISLFCIVCPQISSSWTRSPTNTISFVWKDWNVFSRHIVYLEHSSTVHNMLLVIIDISSMMMTFVDLSFCMTLWGSKYPCVAMQNAMCIVVAMELKQNVVMLIVTNNNTFLPCI